MANTLTWILSYQFKLTGLGLLRVWKLLFSYTENEDEGKTIILIVTCIRI